MTEPTVEDLQAQVAGLTAQLQSAQQRERLLTDTVTELAVENTGLKRIAGPILQAQMRRDQGGTPDATQQEG